MYDPNFESFYLGAPLYLSQPHLLFVEQRIQDLVEGLSPDPEKHWGYMDLNPVSQQFTQKALSRLL